MENFEFNQQAAATAPVAEQTELAYNQVRLSDGRVVEMRETVGSDEMIVAAQLGDVFEPNGSGAVIFQTCLIARTIAKIDGADVPNMRTYESVRNFLGTFKGKDYQKIKKLFEKLNGDGEGND